LALGFQILDEPQHALRLAREAARIAGSRGFRFWNLTASAIVSVVSEDDAEAQASRDQARNLAESLSRSVPDDLLESFLELPRIRALLQPVHFTDEIPADGR